MIKYYMWPLYLEVAIYWFARHYAWWTGSAKAMELARMHHVPALLAMFLIISVVINTKIGKVVEEDFDRFCGRRR